MSQLSINASSRPLLSLAAVMRSTARETVVFLLYLCHPLRRDFSNFSNNLSNIIKIMCSLCTKKLRKLRFFVT